jgi:flagellar FliL protein
VAGREGSSHTVMRGGSSESSVRTFLLLATLTLIGGGGGAFLGMTLGQQQLCSARSSNDPNFETSEIKKLTVAKHQDSRALGRDVQREAGSSSDSHQKENRQSLEVKELPPIVTNLAVPETSWVRLQASIVYDARTVSQPDILAAELMSDVLAFLRTISLTSIEGADGLRRLHEDLSERAAIRSEGRVREFIIQTLVVQ